MRRKNLIAARVKKKKLQIKDAKIKKIYTKFRSIIYKKIKRNSFALAVSGGSDSLCLAYFGKKYTQEYYAERFVEETSNYLKSVRNE